MIVLKKARIFLTFIALTLTTHSLEASTGICFAVLEPADGHEQFYFSSKNFPEQVIKSEALKGRAVKSLLYSGSSWLLVTEDIKGATQIWKKSTDISKAWLEEKHREGYYIRSLQEGKNGFAFVLQKDKQFSVPGLKVCKDLTEVQAFARKTWDNGRRLINAVYANKQWWVSTGRNLSIREQKCFADAGLPTSYVQGNEARGFVTESIGKSPEGWLVVMSSRPGAKEEIIADFDTPELFLKKYLNKEGKKLSCFFAEKTEKDELSEFIEIEWVSPLRIETTNEQLQVKAHLKSHFELSNTELFVNGKKVVQSRGVGTIHLNDFQQNILLSPGENKVTLRLSDIQGNTVEQSRFIKLNRFVAKGRYFALLIGVEDYDTDAWDLQNPEDDAKELKNVLADHYTFQEENIMTLLSPTRAQMIGALEHFAAELKPDDNLLIFYAGHGKMRGETAYWLPRDAAADDYSNWFSSSEVLDYVRRMTCRHVLLVADACYSGAIVMRSGSAQWKACQVQNSLKSRRAITSGAETEVPDESVFLDLFAEALRENDMDCISAEQLYAKVKVNVISNSPNYQVPQFGILQQTDDRGGNFIFKKK